MLEYDRCFLRPIVEADLERLLSWRNSERVRANMYTDHIITAAEHKAWFERSLCGGMNRHLIFGYCGQSLGTVNISQIDSGSKRCLWGFYIGEPSAPKGSGLAMGYLALEYIFGELGIRKLCSEAFRFNSASIGYHKKLGFQEEGCFKEHVAKNGRFEDIICFALFAADWAGIKAGVRQTALKG